MQNIEKKRYIGLFCAFLATLSWASNYPVSRLLFNASGMNDLDEWWASWLRCGFGVIALLPVTFMLKTGGWNQFGREWKRDWKIFFFLSGCIVAESVLCFIALKYTTSARASLLANTSPVFTLLISVLAAKEVLNRRKITGVFLGLVGIILAASSKGGDAFAADKSLLSGDLLALSSGVFWSLFTVFGGVAASRYSGVFCSTFYRICGLFFLLPVLWISGSNITFDLPLDIWLGLIYVAVIPGGIAVWLWSIGQKYTEPGELGVFGYLSAFCATSFSLLFLKEKLNLNFILAFICIICAMILVIRSRK